MSKRWLARTLAGCLAVSGAGALRAQDEPEGYSHVAATEAPPGDRPTELPPLITPPAAKEPKRPVPTAKGPRGNPGDYDPSYLYLPERNPGTRQPPCPCLPLGRVWVNPSYFLGTTVNDGVPPLIASTRGGRTRILHGDDRLEHGFRSGMRLDVGTWLDRCQNLGVEGHFFFMESSLADFEARSGPDLTLSRPYALPGGGRGVEVLGGPGAGSAAVLVTAPLNFLGAEANARVNLFCEDNRRIDAVYGYRFVRLAESLRVATAQAEGGEPSRFVEDRFATENQFHGGQIGLTGEYRMGRWYVDATAKVAFGLTWERLEIEGVTRTFGPGGGVRPGGFLAQRSNSGGSREAEFAAVPEANLTLGYQLTDHWRAFVGYTFLYVTSVARAGEAIDPAVNLTQLPPGPLAGELRPLRRDPATEFWMQGINLGVELRY